MSPQVQVALIAATCSALVGLLGAAGVHRWRRPSVAALLTAVALVTVLSVVAGVAVTAQAMYLSRHDLDVALTVSAAAGMVGVAVALSLSRRVVREVRGLASSAGGDAPAKGQPAGQGIAELSLVADDLARARAQLVTAAARERALESSRRELITWVSHDLRTPLAGLRAMAEALEDGVAEDPSRYHRQIRHEVDRLASLVDDLFELSRIQAGALCLSYQRVDVGDLASDVLAGAGPLARARGVRLDATLGSVVADVDARGLGRAVSNLVVNAIRHTAADGTVGVRTREDGDDTVIAVTDGCGGITDADLPRLFEAGWRGTAARTHGTAAGPPGSAARTHGSAAGPPGSDTGAGLGLAIARGIVEAHHGRIGVGNVAGGCRFEIRLPRIQPREPAGTFRGADGSARGDVISPAT